MEQLLNYLDELSSELWDWAEDQADQNDNQSVVATIFVAANLTQNYIDRVYEFAVTSQRN